jgi:hypothetical protein
MATIAFKKDRDVIGRLAVSGNTIMTTGAVADDFMVIQCDDRSPACRVVTGITDIRGSYVQR